MKDATDWGRRLALTQFGKQPSDPLDLINFVESVINGQDIESREKILELPEEWKSQLSDLIKAARHQGNVKRQRELEAMHSFFHFHSYLPDRHSEALLAQIEEIKNLCHRSDSPAVQSFVLGTMGTTLQSLGLTQASLQLTEEAVRAARRGKLRRAELEWSINLAVFRTKVAPRETDRELRRLLRIARDIGSEKKIGMILNNLAFVNDQFLSNHPDAIQFQEEAISIARRIGDKASELTRTTHLASMQERTGQIHLAAENYDRGLALQAEIGFTDEGMRLFMHESKLIADQYRDRTQETLSSHLQISKAHFTKEDIRLFLEKGQSGHMMGSWDPSLGSIQFTPDNSFANELSVNKQWEALAVYAYHWMDQGFLAGESRGFHWLAVALRSLGYAGTADAALQIAMELPRAFEKGLKSENSGESQVE